MKKKYIYNKILQSSLYLFLKQQPDGGFITSHNMQLYGKTKTVSAIKSCVGLGCPYFFILLQICCKKTRHNCDYIQHYHISPPPPNKICSLLIMLLTFAVV
jgi:hypothetical protein